MQSTFILLSENGNEHDLSQNNVKTFVRTSRQADIQHGVYASIVSFYSFNSSANNIKRKDSSMTASI